MNAFVRKYGSKICKQEIIVGNKAQCILLTEAALQRCSYKIDWSIFQIFRLFSEEGLTSDYCS